MNKKITPLVFAAAFGAAIIVRILFFTKTAFATGLDGYYYVIQVFSMRNWGETFFNDASIVFRILDGFRIFGEDIVLTNKIAAIAVSGFSSLGIIFIAYRITEKKSAALAAFCIYSFTWASFYMSLEFQKNNFGLLFFIWFAAMMLLAEKKPLYYAGAALFFILSFFSHKMTGLLSLIFVSVYFPLLLILRSGKEKLLKILRRFWWVIPLVLAIPILLMITGRFPLRMVDLSHILDEINLSSVLDRFQRLTKSGLTVFEKIEYLLYHVLPLAFLPFLINILRNKTLSMHLKSFWTALWVISLVLINPLLKFSFDEIAYRLLIVSNIPAALFISRMLASGKSDRSKKALIATSGALIILLCLNIPLAFKNMYSGRFPNYKALNSHFTKLKELVPPGKKLITHRGISTYIWWLTGIITENFQPDGDLSRYYRLVYGLGPVHFKKYLAEGNYKNPIRLKDTPYTLMEEKLWQEFYQEKNAEIKFLKNHHNPYKLRPPSAYKFDEAKWKERLKNYSPSMKPSPPKNG